MHPSPDTRRGAVLPLLLCLLLPACSARGGERAPEPPLRPHQDMPGDPPHPPALPAPMALPSAPGEAGVRAFATEFMDARQRGNEGLARNFLSAAASEVYAPGGLSLTGGAEGRSFSRWELASVEPAQDGAWKVQVRVFYPGGSQGDVVFTETLVIGPGLDTSDTERTWIVREASEE
ncbi:MAG TPA: hypothetical protein DD490_00620 [Acidobacteria bacterium]|nr:hypothetical protein [Acidobacteriota bacterium]